MPPDVWALLAKPFPRSSCTWRVVGVADDQQTAGLARTLSQASLAARLDSSVGSANWSFQLLPLGERSLVCNLSVAGVGRSGVATVADGLTRFDATLLAEHALAAAAEQFGMAPGGKAVAWVDFDAETGEPLYLPEDDEEPAAGDAVETEALVGPQAAAEAAAAEAAVAEAAVAEAAAAVADATAAPLASAPDEPPADPSPGGRPTGHEVIERLLDRLREVGLGREAARLIVAHGGYGRTQAEARELYGKLRALLMNASTVTAS